MVVVVGSGFMSAAALAAWVITYSYTQSLHKQRCTVCSHSISLHHFSQPLHICTCVCYNNIFVCGRWSHVTTYDVLCATSTTSLNYFLLPLPQVLSKTSFTRPDLQNCSSQAFKETRLKFQKQSLTENNVYPAKLEHHQRHKLHTRLAAHTNTNNSLNSSSPPSPTPPLNTQRRCRRRRHECAPRIFVL